MTALRTRGVVIGIKGKASSERAALDMSSIEPCHPAAIGKRVHLVGESLVWPVLFLYPEYGETDFIQEFHEDTWLVIFLLQTYESMYKLFSSEQLCRSFKTDVRRNAIMGFGAEI